MDWENDRRLDTTERRARPSEKTSLMLAMRKGASISPTKIQPGTK